MRNVERERQRERECGVKVAVSECNDELFETLSRVKTTFVMVTITCDLNEYVFLCRPIPIPLMNEKY